MKRFLIALLVLAALVVIWKNRTGVAPTPVALSELGAQPATTTQSAYLPFASGYHYLSLQHDGLTRTYGVYVPTSYDNSRATPLLFVLHGTGGDALVTRFGTCPNNTLGNPKCMDAVADRGRFVVVYPEGIDKKWNDGRIVARQAAILNVDDSGFILRILDELGTKLTLDRKRIYVTGISNGALMSFTMACKHADRIAAIAPVAGSFGSNWANGKCNPTRSVPVILFNGDADPLVASGVKMGNQLGVENTVKELARLNGCAGAATTASLPDIAPNDGTTVERTSYANCKNGSEVVSYLIKNGGHTWPDGYQYLGERLIGKTTRDINANEVMWEFFKKRPIR